LLIRPLKCKYAYSVHEEDMESMDTFLEAMHGWLGSMTVCCTPMVRLGKWQIDFHRPGASDPEINIDQSKNLLEVERGNDLLAALCISYAFDKALCQPLVTIIGYQEKEHMDDDDDSLEDFDMEAQPQHPALPAPEYDDREEPAGYIGYDEPEPQPEVAGYLEAEPYRDDPQPEVDGYLQNGGYDDTYNEPDGYLEAQPYAGEENQPDGYLESQPYSEDYQQPDGYLESTPYSDNPEYNDVDGYIEGDHGYNDSPDGYIDNGEYGDQGSEDVAGYIDGAQTDESYASGQQNSNEGYIEGGFKDEPCDDID
jgi:hypothetical protein